MEYNHNYMTGTARDHFGNEPKSDIFISTDDFEEAVVLVILKKSVTIINQKHALPFKGMQIEAASDLFRIEDDKTMDFVENTVDKCNGLKCDGNAQ